MLNDSSLGLSYISPEPILRVRLTNLLASSAKPLRGLDQMSSGFSEGRQFGRIPLLQVFGMTEAGQRACVNIHGAFPYVYIEYPRDNSLEPKTVKHFISRLGSALNFALARTFNVDPQIRAKDHYASSANVIQSITLVKGTPFYGFHIGHTYFLRIAYTKPTSRQLLIRVLAEGAILGQRWDIFEGHLNFELQFLCDFGLSGCGWLEIADARFREPLPEQHPKLNPRSEAHLPSRLRKWSTKTTSGRYLHPHLSPARSTRTTLELDIHVSSILNRLALKPRDLHHDFIELRHGLASERKLLNSLEELWEDERKRRREAGNVGTKGMQGLSYGEREGVANKIPGKGMGWNSEERWWSEVRLRIQQDRDALNEHDEKKSYELSDLLMESSEPKERRDERAKWDHYIPTTFAALTKGWPSEPMPFREMILPSPSQAPIDYPPPTPYDDTLLPSEFVGEDSSTNDILSRTSSQPAEDVDIDMVIAASQAVFDVERKEKANPARDPWGIPITKEEESDDDEEETLPKEQEAPLPWDADFDFEDEFYGTQRVERTDPKEKSQEISMPQSPKRISREKRRREEDSLPSSSLSAAGWESPFQSSTEPSMSPLDSPTNSISPKSKHCRRSSRLSQSPTHDQAPSVLTRASPSLMQSPEMSSGSQMTNPIRSPEISRDADEKESDPKSTPTMWSLPRTRPTITPLEIQSTTSRQIVNVPSSIYKPASGNTTAEKIARSSAADDSFFDASLDAGDDWIFSQTGPDSVLSSLRADRSVQQVSNDSSSPVKQLLMSRVETQSDAATNNPLGGPYGLSSSSYSIRRAQHKSNRENAKDAPLSLPTDTSEATIDQPVLNPSVIPSVDSIISSSAQLKTSAFIPSPSQQSKQSLASPTEYGCDIDYQDPYFSNPVDVPKFPREYAGRLWTFDKNGNSIRPEEVWSPNVFDGIRDQPEIGGSRVFKWGGLKGGLSRFRRMVVGEVASLELGHRAPSRSEAKEWLKKDIQAKENRRKKIFASQIEGPTQLNTQGFKFSQINEVSSSREKRFMSVMSLEVLPATRNGHLPDAREDPILAVFFCFQSDGQAFDNCYMPGCHVGLIIIMTDDHSSNHSQPPSTDPRRTIGSRPIEPEFVSSELDLLNLLTEKVWAWDPDILSGWEVQGASWGYATKRMSLYGGEQFFMAELSPVLDTDGQNTSSEYDSDHSSAFQIQGRHVFNLWRMLRAELNLNQYTFENVAFHLLHRRVPKFSPQSLQDWFCSDIPSKVIRCINHFLLRAVMIIEMLDLSELVSRNAEFARVYGVDFSDVYQRGSQFKVESFMFRIAKPESLLFRTPTREQVGQQAGAECIPMVMEPQSAFYKDPVVVLDFQSLYPSIMLAYNICYSTCLGRADRLKDKDGNPTDRFGFTNLELSPGTLEVLEDHITISPNGMMFVKPTVRKSLLAKMLGEILDTRVMVKDAMKGYKSNKSLTRTLNSRQLALKLLANVTYGYTSASFSGRMPHIQVADSIVQYGRESLEKAISLIHSTPEWGAHVVYGDTDSLFVHLPGKSKEMAFRIGYEMADAITAKNPKPMKLKFEKVYLPCVLQSKKRYVGFKYEHPDELVPTFDDKGIETVRRDGIPAQQKELKECIKLLFRDPDLSRVKEYCYRQWTRILQGRVSVQDFTFAKEVRLGSYSEKSHPPHVVVAAIRANQDPGDEPQYGERVPYVIVQGEPGEPQYRRARRPEDALEDEGLRLDGEYYIQNMLIPPLGRVFNLLGADVAGWYRTMPRPKWIEPAPFGIPSSSAVTTAASAVGPDPLGPAQMIESARGKVVARKIKLTDHFKSDLCFLCKAETHLVPAICKSCRSDPYTTIYALQNHRQQAETRLTSTQLICSSCSSTLASERIDCISLDCPIMYERVKLNRRVNGLAGVGEFIKGLEEEEARRREAEVIDLTLF
ncbi:DNA polymerase zeta, catalytic subunit [Phaffia rhodozyma]|uniref:DNA polymerase n=1 Tax=Phaffia rhodozyma TaxID=264483 RepID=A0A0F7SEK2_PHARH|nr:DNA polymerase zeta, catalytic subunit [Phaffia rhodozyma]